MNSKIPQLYKISDDFLALQKMVESGEATQEMIADTMEGVEMMFEKKAEGVVMIANDFNRHMEMIDAEIDRLKAIKASKQNQRDSLVEYLRLNMERTGIDKISCPLFNITLRKGSPVVKITDESELPDDYVSVKTTISPDKRKILKDLKAGAEISGAEIEIGKTSVLIK